jgi:hypothetical protein
MDPQQGSRGLGTNVTIVPCPSCNFGVYTFDVSVLVSAGQPEPGRTGRAFIPLIHAPRMLNGHFTPGAARNGTGAIAQYQRESASAGGLPWISFLYVFFSSSSLGPPAS